MYSWYNTQYQNRKNITSPLTIQMGAVSTGTQTYSVQADFCMEPGGSSESVKIHMVQVLDGYPASLSNQTNTCMQGYNLGTVTLVPGECQTFTREFVFNSASWTNKENIRIIAFAQENGSNYPAEILNVGQIAWPFPALGATGDYDLDGDVDEDDYSAFYDCMSGDQPANVPDEPCLRAFDFDEDEDVDLPDFIGYLGKFKGTCPELVDLYTDPPGGIVCEGEDITFYVEATGTATLEYQWRELWNPIEGETGATFTIENVTTDDVGYYSVVVSNDCGEVISGLIHLELCE